MWKSIRELFDASEKVELPEGSRYIGPGEIVTPCFKWGFCPQVCPGHINKRCIFYGGQRAMVPVEYTKYFSVPGKEPDELPDEDPRKRKFTL